MTHTQKIVAAAACLLAAGVVVQQSLNTRRLERELRTLGEEHVRSQARARELERAFTDLREKTAAVPVVAAPGTGVAKPEEKAAAAAEAEATRVTRKAPAGWHKNGSNPSAYLVGVDNSQTLGGYPSAYVKSVEDVSDDNFGGMMQAMGVDAYRGKRVRLSGWLKTQDAKWGGQLWMRVDGPEGRVMQFDNMHGRAPKGTSDWEEYSVVLDVPKEATTLNYGFFVTGSGQMWVNGLRIEPVGTDVPSTDLEAKMSSSYPTRPRNLEFSAD